MPQPPLRTKVYVCPTPCMAYPFVCPKGPVCPPICASRWLQSFALPTCAPPPTHTHARASREQCKIH